MSRATVSTLSCRARRAARRAHSFRSDFRLQSFRPSEGDDPAGGDRRHDSRLRIASRALALLANGEVAETAKFHVVTGDERGDDFFEHGVNQFLGLTARNARTSGIDRARDFLLGQRRARQIVRKPAERRCLVSAPTNSSAFHNLGLPVRLVRRIVPLESL